MTIEECYKKLGGDASDVVSRLLGMAFIEKFIAGFLEDGSFDDLCENIGSGRRKEAFRAAHTLKGLCQDLGFGTLFASAEKITEELRTESEEITPEAAELLEAVKRDYEMTVNTIREYLASKSE